jgi:hypothetical protein
VVVELHKYNKILIHKAEQKITLRKKLKTLQNQLNLHFLHQKLTSSFFKDYQIASKCKKSTSQFLLFIIHHEESKESSKEQNMAIFLARLMS